MLILISYNIIGFMWLLIVQDYLSVTVTVVTSQHTRLTIVTTSKCE